MFDLLLSSLPRALVLQFDITIPTGVEQTIPESEERLGEVGLDTPALVVNVMVGGIVGCEMLQRVPRERIAAVIVHGLDRRASEEPHGLANGHPRSQKP